MYRIKVRVSGRLSEMLTRGRGRVVRTPKGDICVFPLAHSCGRGSKVLGQVRPSWLTLVICRVEA